MSSELNISHQTDKETIIGILNNSDKTLNQLYKAHFPMALKLVLSNSGGPDDAKDIFQEAVIVLYNKVQSGNFELSSKLNTYLYSVCRRLWLKKLQHQSKFDGNIQDFEEVLVVEEDIDREEELNDKFLKMGAALEKLGEPCRTIIEDFYLQNRSMQEICERFGYTNTDNAKTQKYKCLQRLKKLFFQH